MKHDPFDTEKATCRHSCFCTRTLNECNIEAFQRLRILLTGRVAAGAPLNETDDSGR